MITTEEKHNYGIDLLRIVAMLIIIAHHFALHSGLIFDSTSSQGTILSIFALGGKTGVNIFVLITGFCSSGTIRWKKVANIIGCTVFYSLVLFFFSIMTGAIAWSGKALLKACVPFLLGGDYWFIVIYLILYILIPILSKVAQDLSERAYRMYLLFFTCVLCFLPSVAGNFIQVNDFGYSSLVWFIYLYFLGAYLHKYDVFTKLGSKIHFILGLFVVVQIVACIAVCWKDSDGILGKLLECFANYSANAVSPLAISVLSLGVFKKLKIRFCEKAILQIGAATLGVYLIHDNSAFRGWLWSTVYSLVTRIGQLPFIVVASLVVLIVFILSSAIEILRSIITAQVRNWISTKPFRHKSC